MKEIIPSINNFPIFFQHLCDLEYDEKKRPKPLKNWQPWFSWKPSE